MSTGTSSGRAQSAILIPVPEAEALVEPYRLQYDPVAIAGVPAHITLIVPWLAPSEIGLLDLAELGDALRTFPPFDFSLQRVSWFGRGVLWLAPQPAAPFVKLTAMLADRFSTLPYEDEFDESVSNLPASSRRPTTKVGVVRCGFSGE